MNTYSWPKRLYSLDVSRGIVALSIVLWHWQHFSYEGDALPIGFSRKDQPLYNVFSLFYEQGEAGVQYFFLLSGFIFFWLYGVSIYNKKVDFWTFCLQRFSRLYPLHLATLLSVSVLQIIYTSREDAPFVYFFNDTLHFLLHLGFMSGWILKNEWSFNAPAWSVSVEVFVYLIFFFAVSFFKCRWFVCLCLSVGASTLSLIFQSPIFTGLSLFFLGGFVFYMTCFILNRNQKLKYSVYAATVVCWVPVITNFYFIDLRNILPDPFLSSTLLRVFPSYILFPLTICTLVLLEIRYGPFLKSVSWIGNITYSSYLLHFPLQLLFGLSVSFGFLDPHFYTRPSSLLAYFSLLIPASYIVFLKFELPAQQSIRGWYGRLQKPQQT